MADNKIKPRAELEEVVTKLPSDFQCFDAHLELPNAQNIHSTINFLKDHFYIDETLTKSMGIPFGPDLYNLWQKRLQEPLSLILVSNSTRAIIGTCTMNAIESGLGFFKNSAIYKNNPFKLIKQGYDVMDVFERYNIDTALRIITLGVHKSYRGKGIGAKIMNATLLFAKDVGLNPVCVCGEATSKLSQHIFEKFEFELCHTINFLDYKAEGEIIFKNTGENDSVKFYAKLM